MAFSITVEHSCFKERCSCSRVSPYLDGIVGIALIVIGLLGLYSVIGINTSVSYIMIGSGIAYAGLVLYQALAKFICKCNC